MGRLYRVLLVCLAFMLIAASVNVEYLVAQQQTTPILQITEIDASSFPNVRVVVAGHNLGQNVTEVQLALSEGDEEITNLARTSVEAGTQVALVLDASGSIHDNGQSGQPRYLEVGLAARRIPGLGVLSVQSDWLASYAMTSGGQITTLHPWSRDHQAVVDSLYTYTPPQNQGVETPLFDLLYFVLTSFRSQDVPDKVSRSIVVFSDGESGSSNLDSEDAVQTAVRAGVPIHTVLLGNDSEQARSNMARIATLTGGQFYQMSQVDALDALWYSVAGQRNQALLTYRSHQRQPANVTVKAILPDRTELEHTRDFPIVNPAPVQVQVLQPGTDAEIVKTAPAFDTPVKELNPKQIDVQVSFAWPDGQPRDVVRVEYTIDDDTRIVSEPPFERFQFPIANLDDGNHTLRVTAVDDLGIEGASDPVAFQVIVNRPPRPEPPLEVVGVPVPEPIRNYLDLITLSLATSALVFAIVALFALRKPERRARVTKAVQKGVKRLTKPAVRGGRGDLKGVLILAAGNGSLPREIRISKEITKIGADSAQSHEVVDQEHVSGLHCRITEEGQGQLSVWDEYSRNGTYVNSVEIKPGEGRVLESGDLIGLGPEVEYRFVYKGDYENGGGSGRRGKDATQPSRRVRST